MWARVGGTAWQTITGRVRGEDATLALALARCTRPPMGRRTSGEVEKLSKSAAAEASLESFELRSDNPGVLLSFNDEADAAAGTEDVSRTSDSSPYAGKERVLTDP